MATTYDLRPANEADVQAVAELHVRAWQMAYRGLMPESYLSSLQPRDWAKRYDFSPGDRTKPTTLVALEGERVLGFATVSAHACGCAGRLSALYVDPDLWGQGCGRALVGAARERLVQLGCHEAELWVVVGNERAEQFYRRDGWVADGIEKVDKIRGIAVHQRRYRRSLLETGSR